jgi:L-threonylcarbamoyladenylate synthase
MTDVVSNLEIGRAVDVLRRGGLVAFPTETVYGLGADARNESAVRRIFEAKGRPATHPVIVHLADAAQVAAWAREIPAAARQLGEAFWPGPLTLVLRRARAVSDVVTGGQDTVALRVPAHPVARQLLARFGGGIAAPSANRHGRVSATTAEHVRSEFGNAVGCVLDGGEADLGIESTIIDVSGPSPVLLRPGVITPSQIAGLLGRPLAAPAADAPRAPGTLAAHYAPRTPLLLVEGELALELAASLARQGQRIAMLALSAQQPLTPGLTWIAAPLEAAGYAHALYASLRRLDEDGCDSILVERPPQGPEWAAINDRLARAAAGAPAPEAL